MSNEKHLNRITIIVIIGAALAAFILMCFSFDYQAKEDSKPSANKNQINISTDYVDSLFDASFVHTIDIEVPKVSWNYMVENAMDEQYVLCDVTIDGNKVDGVGIRPKGNSSLQSIAMSDSERFSFKIEFDHYTAGTTYQGLDKLALNNLGQDMSGMKDFLSYTMMGEMGLPAPLCSYAMVNLNGEPFGLYLAVEALEESFVNRNYGSFEGNLYMPDVYAIEAVQPEMFMTMDYSTIMVEPGSLGPGDRLDILGPIINNAFTTFADDVFISAGGYLSDDVDDYSVVFDSSTFPLDKKDKQRYVEAVRNKNFDMDNIISYTVANSFLNNYDCYNGLFVHNFLVYEENGMLSLVPWDYNLAFGAFSVESAYNSFLGDWEKKPDIDMAGAMSSDKSYVNWPIDEPVVSAKVSDRPYIQVIFDDPGYVTAYHDAYRAFIKQFLHSGRYEELCNQAFDLIKPYADAGYALYSTEKLEEGKNNVLLYGKLRMESASLQLAGRMPANLEGQSEKHETLLEVDGLDMSKTIDFSGLAWGITSDDAIALADIVDQEMGDLNVKHMIKRIIGEIPIVRSFVEMAMEPPMRFLFTIFLMWFALHKIKKWRRYQDAA